MPAVRKKPATSKRSTGTPDRILDVAGRLMQTRGYNGFSYADVAAEIGITKASLHHHFSTKAVLGAAILERYARGFRAALAAIDAAGLGAPLRLERYARLHAKVLRQDRLCLCGILAAEYLTLPAPMQRTIRAFFADNERWLARVIGEGRSGGSLHPQGSDEQVALMLLGGLEGAMLVAWPLKDMASFAASARRLLASLGGPANRRG
ncbi:MAG: TetR/AcrR family transcriptional regulator [Gammaproteobacteria bacterium]|nr:TetR/AcrR family transcriptional regulator [Gammaproteobacteria bacterium]